MKKTITLFSALAAATAFVNAQPVFQKTFAASSDITGTRAAPATNGVIVAGHTENTPYDAFLIKTDLSGTLSWSKSYGGSGDETFNSVRQTSDGGFIAAGYTSSSGAGGRDALVVKTDASGNVSWAKTYGTVDDEVALDIILTSDGGYAFTGDAKKVGANTLYGAISLVKLTSTGTESWSKMWGAGIGNYGYQLIQTGDGGYLVGGRANNGFFSFIKTDASGTISWARASITMSTPSADIAQMIATADGGYLVVGNGTNSSNDALIILEKLDATCTVQWVRTYNPGPSAIDLVFGVNQAWNGDYCITGFSGNFSPGWSNLYFLNISSTGTVISAKTSTVMTYGNSRTSSVTLLSDGGFVYTGSNGTALLLVKADGNGNTGCTYSTAAATEATPNYFDNAITNWTSSGTTITGTASVTGVAMTLTSTSLCSGVGLEESETINTIGLYPNPVSDELNIDLQNTALGENVIVQVYDALGQIVIREATRNNAVTIRISLEGLDRGIYLVVVSDESYSASGRVVVE